MLLNYLQQILLSSFIYKLNLFRDAESAKLFIDWKLNIGNSGKQ